MPQIYYDPLTGENYTPISLLDALENILADEIKRQSAPPKYHEPMILLPPESMPELRAMFIAYAEEHGKAIKDDRLPENIYMKRLIGMAIDNPFWDVGDNAQARAIKEVIEIAQRENPDLVFDMLSALEKKLYDQAKAAGLLP